MEQCLPARVTNLPNFPDSIALARELGRLDLVSILLACLGIFLAIFAISGFGYIRYRANQISSEVAKTVAAEVTAEIVPGLVEKSVPGLVDKAVEFHMNQVGDDFGNRVAEAYGTEDEND